MDMKKTNLDNVLSGPEVGRWEKIRLILSLSLPAILAQLTTIAMQYIDAAMVGSLGAGATACPICSSGRSSAATASWNTA